MEVASTPSVQKVNDFIAFIRELNGHLQGEIELSPANLRVTDLIRRLSIQLRSHYLPEEIQSVLSNEYIRMNQRKLQDKLSEAEFLEELDYARHVCKSEDSGLEFVTRLPNWHIYMALVSEELSTLRRFIRKDGQTEKSPIVFVGSGPLPLSPIILHLCSDVEVICLEIDSAAYDASCSLLDRIGLGTKVTVILDNGSAFDYSSYNRIFVASLVRNKTAVLDRIRRTSPYPLVAVRTAVGMRQIMYEGIDESELSKQGWRIQARTWPDEKLVINSTLFLDRAAASGLPD
ncbi:nicotianamine synthase family protein [Paenibacillus sp. LHD-117]|uniref:nicotianamine synthase family protein n=1 Tax=Paenibacillus sp. LHD-117 TaxID=3071412 RepID=UPI0027E1CCDB|nr:nicotianamine synthase family protein [Paenibacillus sp. LHD-117]MDQ6417979.1 nicotianamine synthase family protein [Paenibacillus sp. LHD-117]